MALKTDRSIKKGTNLNFLYSEFDFCTKDSPVVAKGTYCRISSLDGDKSEMVITVACFVDETALRAIEQCEYKFTPSLTSTDNFIAQAYAHLKTLPEFADAIDC